MCDDSTHRGFDFCSSVIFIVNVPFSPVRSFHFLLLHVHLAGIFLHTAWIWLSYRYILLRIFEIRFEHKPPTFVNTKGRVYIHCIYIFVEKLIGWSAIITRTMIAHTTHQSSAQHFSLQPSECSAEALFGQACYACIDAHQYTVTLCTNLYIDVCVCIYFYNTR